MVHIYYHIYAINGVESIIDEQLSLIENNFNFPYTLNVGIAIANENISTSKVLEKFTKPNHKIRDIRAYYANEFTTLDLIENDKEKFGDSDYILYIHTKGASKQTHGESYKNIQSWRHLMNYFNIEKVKNVFKIFEKTEFNTYGALFNKFYMGNFWWMRGNYAKTIHVENIDKSNRYQAEAMYLSNSVDFKPYSAYNIESQNPYIFEFKREEYAK